MPLYYRLSLTEDPEDRLEDACLWKALADHYGSGITLVPSKEEIPADGLAFGRQRHFGDNDRFAGDPAMLYPSDPGFLSGVSRMIAVCDLETAETIIAKLHAQDKDAFIKGIRQKVFAGKVARGQSLSQAMGAMIWSFVDNGSSLIAQEYVPMRYERRFVVIGRKIITESPVATHLTPLSRSQLREETGVPVEQVHFVSPHSRSPVIDPDLSTGMRRHVERTIERSELENYIVDVAQTRDGIETIEFNPCQPGMFGLFACDPAAITRASEQLLPEDLRQEVRRRRAQGDPKTFTSQMRTKSSAEPSGNDIAFSDF